MYDLTYGLVFGGTPTRTLSITSLASSEATPFSRGKAIAVLVGLMLGATTAAGAVTIRHKHQSFNSGFTSQLSSSSTNVVGSAGFEVALY
jgi:hypothetical protein